MQAGVTNTARSDQLHWVINDLQNVTIGKATHDQWTNTHNIRCRQVWVCVWMLGVNNSHYVMPQTNSSDFALVAGNGDEVDAKRVRDFGIPVDVDALKAFIGVKKEKAPAKKKATKKKVAPKGDE